MNHLGVEITTTEFQDLLFK